MTIRSARKIQDCISRDSYAGERLNALFLSHAMDDGDAVRFLIHNQFYYTPDFINALYNYHQTRDKEGFLDRIEELNEETNCLFLCTETSNGERMLVDCNLDRRSHWQNLEAYDEKHTLSFLDDTGTYQSRDYIDMSVAEVLKEVAEHRLYTYSKPRIENKKLNLLLNNIYQANNLHEPTYFQALKDINKDLCAAFNGKREALPYEYIDAIKLLEDKSKFIFDTMDYRRQRSFYQSDMGQELLKFSYLTSYTKKPFNEEEMNRFLTRVKNAGLWQKAQYMITGAIISNTEKINPLNQRFLRLALIRPKPDERMYQGYYEDDLKRAQYLNLYLKQREK